MSTADEISKLNDLKASGAITDVEFQAEKQKLLARSDLSSDTSTGPADGITLRWADVPIGKKWWLHVVLLLLLPPIGILLTIFVPAFKKNKTGAPERIGKVFKTVCVCIALALWGINFARFISPDGLPVCESSNAKATLTQAFDQSQMARDLNLSVVQVRSTTTKPGSTDKQRRCSADLMLNNGESIPVDFSMVGQNDGTFFLDFEMR